MPTQHKRCCWCHKTKPISEFHIRKASKDGHQGFCKACGIRNSGLSQSEWRRKAIERLGGARCVHCGCEIYDLLQINHTDGSGGIDRKQNGMVSGKLWRHIALGLRDISNLEVVCLLCNQRHYVEHILGYQGFTVSYTPQIQKFPKKF